MFPTKVPTTWLMVIVAALVTSTGATPAQSQDAADGGDGLKWTPHRAAVATVPDMPEPPQGDASIGLADADLEGQADSSDRGPLGSPASVTLPAHVPTIDDESPVQPRLGTLGGMTRRAPAPRSAGDRAGVRPPLDRPALGGFFDRDFTRAPRPEGRRPTAARPANGSFAGPPGGSPQRGSAAAGRPERLAMNVDGMPSVMTRAQVGALDDSGVPGRVPPGAGAAEVVRTPMAGSSSRIEGPSPAIPYSSRDFAQEGGYELGGEEFFGMPHGDGMPFDESYSDELMLGGYPAMLHVESFYDDPYACEDDEGLLPLCNHHGRICEWLRRFGRPYYGWRWYRDFTASGGVMAFTNGTDLGLNGNFGTNEYLNWAMPFWNAFGIGWQVGARATQSNFQPTALSTPGGRLQTNTREQVFVTTGFFTRAFEGRGLQGGAVYDYLSDTWFDNVDVAQIRTELSYVWGYHEFGYWGAHNIGNEVGLFGPVTRTKGVASTVDLHCAFYRLQFGDANEWKVWGGGTGDGDGIVGSFLRAPMSRSWALEGTFTYLIPGRTKKLDVDRAGTEIIFSPAAWNVGVNVVFYPAARARRSLASPYRPLFDVADNGSMIRSIAPFLNP